MGSKLKMFSVRLLSGRKMADLDRDDSQPVANSDVGKGGFLEKGIFEARVSVLGPCPRRQVSALWIFFNMEFTE
jgi:hypothetical protein